MAHPNRAHVPDASIEGVRMFDMCGDCFPGACSKGGSRGVPTVTYDALWDLLDSGSYMLGGHLRTLDYSLDYPQLFEGLGRMPYLVVRRLATFGHMYRLQVVVSSFADETDALAYARLKTDSSLALNMLGRMKQGRDFHVVRVVEQ